MASSTFPNTLTDDQQSFRKVYKDLAWIHREDNKDASTSTNCPQTKDAETTTELVEVNCFTCGMHFYDYPYQHNFKDLMVAETKIFKANLSLMRTFLPQVRLNKLSRKQIEKACQPAVRRTHTLPVQIPIKTWKRNDQSYKARLCKTRTTNFSRPRPNLTQGQDTRQGVPPNQKICCPGSVLTNSSGKEDVKDLNSTQNNNIIFLD